MKLTPEKAHEIFKNICSIQYPDGVVFDTENITAQQIIEQAKYKGIRVKIIAKLDTIKQPLQIDLGIGDALFKPLEVEYPTLLDFDNPVILAYSPHSVIAEKFEAMIWLSEINSRMKDFYDVYTLLKSENLDKENLRMAIKQTFEHRQTEFTYPHPLFNEAFPRDTDRIKQWEAFLKRNKLLLNLSFYEVWKEIVSVLEPIYKELSQADN